MTLKNVVKANIYLSNLSRDFGAVNEVSRGSGLRAAATVISLPFSIHRYGRR
jgi:hypothetical protein